MGGQAHGGENSGNSGGGTSGGGGGGGGGASGGPGAANYAMAMSGTTSKHSVVGDALSLAREVGLPYLQSAFRVWFYAASPRALGLMGLALFFVAAFVLRPLCTLLWRLFWSIVFGF